MSGGELPGLDQRVMGDLSALDDFMAELTRRKAPLPTRIDATPERVECGLAKLALTLIDVVRRLLEQQALRRIEAGSLSDEQIERMGQTFLKLNERMMQLKVTFGLEDEDLNLDLGPIADLM